jgi:hypothetical protein
MILLDDDLSSPKLQSLSNASNTNNQTTTLRHSDTRSLSPLPDYETSEAQHNRYHRPRAKRIADARFWRATCVALAIYVGLTIVLGVPFYVVVRRYDHNELN